MLERVYVVETNIKESKLGTHTRKLDEAESEAVRFLARVKELKEAMSVNKWRVTKERAAMLRASLDLSRALSSLRNNPEV